MKYNLLCLCVAACTATHLYAQGTVEDYRRAFDAPRRFSADQVYYAPVDARWVGATHHFWYKNHTPKGDEYVLVDADAKSGPCCSTLRAWQVNWAGRPDSRWTETG